MKTIIETNSYQTPITDELLAQYPSDVVEEKVYTVYRHISPSGRVYIGITTLTLLDRWGNGGCRYKRCKLFYRAIQKYGWDNFIHEIILNGVSKSEAIYTEKYLIKWYKLHGVSYNITDGGESTKGIHMPEEAKRQISKRLHEIQGKAVLQYTLNGDLIKEYKSAADAARELGCGHTSVSNCASGRRGNNLLYGYIFIYKDNIVSLPRIVESCSEHWRKYKIIQCKDGVIIGTYDSIREAERSTGVNRVCIRKNIRGEFGMAGGYSWKKVIS